MQEAEKDGPTRHLQHHDAADKSRLEGEIVHPESPGKHDEEQARNTDRNSESKWDDEHDPVQACSVADVLSSGERLIDGGHSAPPWRQFHDVSNLMRLP